MHILVLHGPNLNLLGSREPGLYGSQTLEEINKELEKQAVAAGNRLSSMQSNSETDLINRVQAATADGVDVILFNPAAFTHTSVALRDALLAVAVPFYEVHLTNPHSREEFRRTSYFSDIARGVICGFGPTGYRYALEAAMAATEPTGSH